jgi:hypothetical protein
MNRRQLLQRLSSSAGVLLLLPFRCFAGSQQEASEFRSIVEIHIDTNKDALKRMTSTPVFGSWKHDMLRVCLHFDVTPSAHFSLRGSDSTLLKYLDRYKPPIVKLIHLELHIHDADGRIRVHKVAKPIEWFYQTDEQIGRAHSLFP